MASIPAALVRSPLYPSPALKQKIFDWGLKITERCENDWKEDISDWIHDGIKTWDKIKGKILGIGPRPLEIGDCAHATVCLVLQRMRAIFQQALKENGNEDTDNLPPPLQRINSDFDISNPSAFSGCKKKSKKNESNASKKSKKKGTPNSSDDDDNDNDDNEEKKENNQCHPRCEPCEKIKCILKSYPATDEQMTREQLSDYLCHIKEVHSEAVHDNIDVAECVCMDIKDEIRRICLTNKRKFKCSVDCESECEAVQRHYHSKDSEHDTDDVDVQHFLDTIHVMFHHSPFIFDVIASCPQAGCTVEDQKEMDKFAKCRPCSDVLSVRTEYIAAAEHSDPEESKQPSPQSPVIKRITYIGKKQDDEWWKDVNGDTPYNENENKQIYSKLIENMGVFRWQNPHGFEPGANREITHYQPKRPNIKQEVLENPYYALPVFSWNQTLRKAKIFAKNSVGRKIRSTRKSYYHDQVTGHKEEWDVGQSMKVTEIIILKLYTDFDKLQFQLKKCFRFETFDDVLEQYSDPEQLKAYEKRRDDLKNRLEWFYHWRGGLLIVLKKFGTNLSDTNKVLYHGVNSKMVIRPSQTRAFQGPLSTTSSYHVARTFATDKGMVLKITSHFPKLSYCNAFDVSLISDYPEEQEWLVGFMYVRLLEVRTRKLVDDEDIGCFNRIVRKVPLSSIAREMFFAIHLFKEQILSMSEHLERILVQFLKVNRREVCEPNTEYQRQEEEQKDWKKCGLCKDLCAMAHPVSEESPSPLEFNFEKQDIPKEKKADVRKLKKIIPILWAKFEEFRTNTPRAKFDVISEALKRFFMQKATELDLHQDSAKNARKWVVSFAEITTVYPNVNELIFINQYDFTNEVLGRLIEQIKPKGKGIANKIQKVTFLYYEEDKTNPENDKTNADYWKKRLTDIDNKYQELKQELEKLGWIIKHHKTGQSGYKIRIYKAKAV